MTHGEKPTIARIVIGIITLVDCVLEGSCIPPILEISVPREPSWVTCRNLKYFCREGREIYFYPVA